MQFQFPNIKQERSKKMANKFFKTASMALMPAQMSI